MTSRGWKPSLTWGGDDISELEGQTPHGAVRAIETTTVVEINLELYDVWIEQELHLSTRVKLHWVQKSEEDPTDSSVGALWFHAMGVKKKNRFGVIRLKLSPLVEFRYA